MRGEFIAISAPRHPARMAPTLPANGASSPMRQKLAVVTGACGGIGAALTALLRERGYFVVGLDMRSEAEQPQPPLPADLFLQCDVRELVADDGGKGSAAAEAVRHIVELAVAYGGVALLVNNAATQIVKARARGAAAPPARRP